MDAKNISSNRKGTLRKSLLTLLTLSTIATAACAPGGGGGSGGGSGGGGGGNPPGGNPNPGASETFVVPKNNVISYSFSDGTVNLSSPISNLSTGDIIISGIVPEKVPYGFLQKVTAMSPDRKTIYTDRATLENAVKDLSFQQSGLSPGVHTENFNRKEIIESEDIAV